MSQMQSPTASLQRPYRSAAPLAGDPRRAVPLTTQIPLAIGGAVALFGWIFVITGCAISWFFMTLVDARGLWANAGAQQSAPAEVKEVARTHVEASGRRVHRVDYELTASGRTYRGRSYTDGQTPAVGAALAAEYPVGHPEDSHLTGMRRAPLPIGGSLVLLFPLAGVGLVLSGSRDGRRAIGLLRHGREAQARFVDKRETWTRINNRGVYAVRLRFEADDGQPYDTIARTLTPEQFENGALAHVFYLPADPRQAAAVDHLPGRPQLNADGTIGGKPVLATAYVLVVLLAIAVNAIAAWLVLR
jgi:hypothetical protein